MAPPDASDRVTAHRETPPMTITRHDISTLMSAAVVHGDTVYLQGLVPNDTSAAIGGQTQQVLDRIDAALATAGSDKSKLLSAQIWLSDISERDAMNEVWVGWIDKANPPVRACVEARLARPDIRIEIMVVAAR
jgi:enamine deaminase RidA (YjgF/YER057c/UK114 family)